MLEHKESQKLKRWTVLGRRIIPIITGNRLNNQMHQHVMP